MMITLINQILIIQILVPIFSAILCVALPYKVAKQIPIFSIIINIILSIISCSTNKLIYNFGNWNNSIGIQYVLDNISKNLILLTNLILCFFLLFYKKYINELILNYIEKNNKKLFFVMILIIHASYISIFTTNDIFNLYISLEIITLVTSVLIIQGDNKKTLIVAIDYLIIGSLASTIILIGIGFIFIHTGNLNIEKIEYALNKTNINKILISGVSFMLIGSLLKSPLFPIHFWSLRFYNFINPIILGYVGTINSIIHTYIIIRLIHFIIFRLQLMLFVIFFVKILSIISMLVCSCIISINNKSIRKTITYYNIIQFSNLLLISVIIDNMQLLFQLIVTDSINKISIFVLLSHIELNNKISIKNNNYIIYLYYTLIIINLFFIIGLPFSSLFFLKFNILTILIQKHLFTEFIAIIISSMLSVIYYYRITEIFLISKELIYCKTIYKPLFVITVVQILWCINISINL